MRKTNRVKRVVVSVTNDLVTDNRVDKVCRSLMLLGWEVCLIGRKLPGSAELNRTYSTVRFKLPFSKGVLFYAVYNIRLFVYLLFAKADVFHANDLDTLLANYLAAKVRGKTLIYDSHEIFPEVPEVVNRKWVKWVWESLERWLFKKPKAVFTVNNSIANYYSTKYSREVFAVRNIPEGIFEIEPKTRKELGLPEDKFIVILQGSGINVHRGAEELVEAMKNIDEKVVLLICGNGDVVPWLKQYVANNNLVNRVIFKARMPFSELMQYTENADLGVSLDKSNNLNYTFSLPNKIFDYLHAGIPVLISDLVEPKKIVNKYNVGYTLNSGSANAISEAINYALSDADYMQKRKNTQVAASELTWENEFVPMKMVYGKLIP